MHLKLSPKNHVLGHQSKKLLENNFLVGENCFWLEIVGLFYFLKNNLRTPAYHSLSTSVHHGANRSLLSRTHYHHLLSWSRLKAVGSNDHGPNVCNSGCKTILLPCVLIVLITLLCNAKLINTMAAYIVL